MTTARPAPFRAGRRPGESPESLPAVPLAYQPSSASPVVYLADISEFQPDVADAAYLRWSQAIVIRAMYGESHVDKAWYGGQRRAALHQGGAAFVGLYQYVVAGQDPVAQAEALVRLLGPLRPGEKVIADIEEGSGNLAETWRLWSAVVAGATGDIPWVYSGEYFAAAHGLAPVTWVAAYGSAEPAPAHVLWQFTDAFTIPGIGTADCSVYRGSIDALAARAYGGRPAPPPVPSPAPAPAPATGWTETMMNDLSTLAYGAAGEDVKTVQGLLCARGYAVTVDGNYGTVTRTAVTALQHAKNLVADGVCGPHTWYALHNRTG